MGKFFILVAIAVLLTYLLTPLSPIPWLAQHGIVILLLIIFALMIAMVLIAVFSEEGPKCTVAPGSTVQWTGRTYGKSVTFWAFLTIPNEPDHFCKVYDQSLYNMGIGYTTNREYTGVKVDRP